MDSTKRLIAVSGVGGFIGNSLIRYLLNNGFAVRGMDNFYKGHCDALFGVINHPDFEFISGSVTELKDCDKLVQGADAVVHLASIVGFPQCAKVPELAEAVNVKGAANMVKAAGNIPFVFTSTGSVYGSVTDSLCTEETPCNTNTVYGITKRKAEEIVLAKPNSTVYRYATAFGVSPCMRVQLLVNDFVHRALNDRSIVVFEADFKRTFIHIKDFVRSILFAIDNIDKMNGKVYNCGSNDLNWSKRQLAEYIKEKTGCFVVYGNIGKDLDCRNYEVDYSKLMALGFTCKVSMEEGINDLIKATPILKTGNRYEV